MLTDGFAGVLSVSVLSESSHLRLADAVADAMHTPGLTEDLRGPLDVLVSRLEAHPAYVEIWGMERLGNGSMLRQINIVISFFVLMLQLKPQSSYSSDFEPTSELTYFDRCYDEVVYNPSINQTIEFF